MHHNKRVSSKNLYLRNFLFRFRSVILRLPIENSSSISLYVTPEKTFKSSLVSYCLVSTNDSLLKNNILIYTGTDYNETTAKVIAPNSNNQNGEIVILIG
jgi:hypothetical protein